MRLKLVPLAVSTLAAAGFSGPAMAGGAAVLHAIGLLADVQTLTTGLTLNQTAADTYCSVTVLGLQTTNDPPASTGLFSAGSDCSLTVGGASATANAQATVGNWEPFSSAGTVLTSRPTKATAALINNNPASAEASATAAINGRVTTTRDIQPPPLPGQAAAAAPNSTPLLFTLEFKGIEAQVGGDATSFDYGLDFQEGSAYADVTFARGRIGGAGTEVFFPFLEASNPLLASSLRQQFLAAFAPSGTDIDVSSYLMGHQLLPSGPEGAFGFEFEVPLNEEYVITSNLASVSSASAVPEPGALSLLLVGTAGIAAWRRKRV